MQNPNVQNDKPLDRSRRVFRPQFSIRRLLILFTAISGFLAFIVPWHFRAQAQLKAIETIEDHGGRVAYDFEYESRYPYLISNPPEDPDFFCRLLGSEYFRSPVYVALHYEADEFIATKFPPHRYIDENSEPVAALRQFRSGLKHLDIRFTLIKDLSFLQGFDSLEILNAQRQGLEDISPLSHVKELKQLDLFDNPIKECSVLSELVSLERLVLVWHHLESLDVLKECDQLRELNASGKELKDISALVGKSKLRVLNLNHSRVSDLSALEGLNLQSLNIGQSLVADIGPLKTNVNLERLYANGTMISDLSALEGKAKLTHLFLVGTNVSDLSSLRGLEQLKQIAVSGTNVVDGSVLLELPNLERCFVPPVIENAIGERIPLGTK